MASKQSTWCRHTIVYYYPTHPPPHIKESSQLLLMVFFLRWRVVVAFVFPIQWIVFLLRAIRSYHSYGATSTAHAHTHTSAKLHKKKKRSFHIWLLLSVYFVMMHICISDTKAVNIPILKYVFKWYSESVLIFALIKWHVFLCLSLDKAFRKYYIYRWCYCWFHCCV